MNKKHLILHLICLMCFASITACNSNEGREQKEVTEDTAAGVSTDAETTLFTQVSGSTIARAMENSDFSERVSDLLGEYESQIFPLFLQDTARLQAVDANTLTALSAHKKSMEQPQAYMVYDNQTDNLLIAYFANDSVMDFIEMEDTALPANYTSWVSRRRAHLAGKSSE